MNKKLIPIIIGVLVLVGIGVGVFAYTQMSGSNEETPQNTKKKVTAPVNVIPVAERPFMQIIPTTDRKITIVVDSLKKPATSVEYEVEYQTGTLLQGFSETLDLGTLPAERSTLLGSCSAGGACTFHEDVQGGNITSTFDGPEVYALKSDWRYFDNKAKSNAFSSRDAKFQISSPSLATQRYVVVFNSPGYPGELPSALNSDLYALAGSSPLTGQAQLKIRSNGEGNLTIVGWDGNEWQTFETTTDGPVATATVDLLPLYAVVTSTEGGAQGE